MAYNHKLELSKPERFVGGHRLCAGCGAGIVCRAVTRALDEGDRAVICNATGCLEVSSFLYPYTAWEDSYIHSAFENAAATCGGVEAAYRFLKRRGSVEDSFKFLAIGGDGGTYDIGFQSLSGAMERGHDMVYFCYDNEAYMNTGNQRSSATTLGASTKTTPTGKKESAKNIDFMLLHTPLVYQATASVGNIPDFKRKLKKAASKDGPCFIHVLAPCPSGWKFPTDQTIEVAKLAIKSGAWLQFEREDGKITINTKPTDFQLINQYLDGQKRFGRVTPEIRERIIAEAKGRYETLCRLAELDCLV